MDLFESEPPRYKDKTFEEDFELKYKTLNFQKPIHNDESEEVNEPIELDMDNPKDKEAFELEMRELFLESQKNEEAEDEPLEELNGMAHQPSKKVQLMEQSEERRRKLRGIDDDSTIDTSDFKEKLEVPAYQRKKVNLRKSPSSSESLVSKYNLNGDNELGNNRFLHDNVD